MTEITIDISEYKDLLNIQMQFSMLETALYKKASVNWSGTGLSFDDDLINNVLCLSNPKKYEFYLSAAKEDKERKETEQAIKEALNGGNV